jgi:sec-independent protein translocase protein TatA
MPRLEVNRELLMGFHGISIGSLLIIFLIAILLFGTKRLRIMAEDLGAALRNFNKALRAPEEGEAKKSQAENPKQDSQQSSKDFNI